jgi:hypothetical protein
LPMDIAANLGGTISAMKIKAGRGHARRPPGSWEGRVCLTLMGASSSSRMG